MEKNNIRWKKEEWDIITGNHIEEYSNQYPRYGAKVKQILEYYKIMPENTLELATFSAKDSRFLATQLPDCKCYALDFSREAVDWAQKKTQRERITNLNIVQADAFNLPFKDKSIDISFHADLYIYYGNNDILRLFNEQKRVTKNLMVIFVHNKYNLYRLLYKYISLLNKDPWYKFGAYSVKELRNIFADQEIVASGGVDSYVSKLSNTVGKGFIGRPLCPEALSDKINKSSFFNKSLFWEIIYVVIKAGD